MIAPTFELRVQNIAKAAMLEEVTVMTAAGHWAMQVNNHSVWRHNRLILQSMFSFVTVVRDLLISDWPCNTADRPINKSNTTINRRSSIGDCVSKTFKSLCGETNVVVNKEMLKVVVDVVDDMVAYDNKAVGERPKNGFKSTRRLG